MTHNCIKRRTQTQYQKRQVYQRHQTVEISVKN